MAGHRQKTVVKDAEELNEGALMNIPRTRLPRCDAVRKAGRFYDESDEILERRPVFQKLLSHDNYSNQMGVYLLRMVRIKTRKVLFMMFCFRSPFRLRYINYNKI